VVMTESFQNREKICKKAAALQADLFSLRAAYRITLLLLSPFPPIEGFIVQK
jgi:hypothetical protein